MEKRKVSKRRQTGTTAKDDIELFQSPPNSPLLTPKSSHLATSLEAPSQLQTPLSSPPTSRPPSPNPTDIPCLIPLPNSRPSTPSFRESQNDNICNNNNCSSSISNSNNFSNNNNSISVATIIARNNQEIIDDENTKKGSSTSSSNNRHHSNLHQHQNHNTNLHNSSYHSSPSSSISTSISSSSSTPPPFTRCPPEIIYNIFEILCKMHQTTLFSCVLVDHQWNAIGTNVLWNSPRFTHMRSLDKFIKTIEYNNDNNNNSSSSSSSSPFKSSSSQLPIATASSPTSTSPSSPISQSTSSSSPISQSSSTSSPISAKIYHPYASYIRTLDLTYLTEHDRNNSALSSHLLRLLPLIHMENLHTLNLSFVKGITNNYLTKLLSPFFNCVKTLNLAGGSRSDKCLSSIIPYCHQVQNLSLAWNTSLSDTSINKIATICGGSLRKLDLTNCEKVSDISLIYISQYCTKLRELKVSYCRGVSEEGIRAVIERCETLRVLDLVGCLNVDKYFLLKCNDEFGLGKCRDLKLIWRRLVENNVPPSSSPLPSSSSSSSSSSPSPSLSSLSPSSSSSLLSSTNATTFSILISLSTSPTSSSTSSSLWNDDNN